MGEYRDGVEFDAILNIWLGTKFRPKLAPDPFAGIWAVLAVLLLLASATSADLFMEESMSWRRRVLA